MKPPAFPSVLVVGVLLGALAGLGYARALPKVYEASMAIHFPSTDVEMFRQILQAVSRDSASNETLGLIATPPEDEERVGLAREILLSRAASVRATEAAGLKLNPEQIESFRSHNLDLETRPGSVLALAVRDRSLERARSLCQHYLDYYDEFVADQSLTHTGKVRKSLEKRYLAAAGQVRKLELKLLSAQEIKQRHLGDSLVAQSESTRELLAKGREQEAALSSDSLERLRKLRAELQIRQPGELPGADPWALPEGASQDPITATLGKEKLTYDRYRDTPVPRPEEVVARAQLERNYEDMTALHRILLLQHGILRTLEELEELDYKVIDPLSVHQVSRSATLATGGLVGALIGLLLGGLLSALKMANSELGGDGPAEKPPD